MSRQITVMEVSPRDGLQNEAVLVSTEDKLELIERSLASGAKRIEVTSFVHPMDPNVGVSVPRFAWGRFFQEGRLLKLPFNVQVHHALVDGIHMGRFYAAVQEFLHDPAFVHAA